MIMRIVMGMLLAIAATAAAGAAEPSVRVSDFGFEPDTFFVDVSFDELGDLAGQRLGGIGVGLTLSGSGTGHLQANAPAMRQTGAEWAVGISPKPFAWQAFDGQSTAANSGGPTGLTTFGMLDPQLDLTPSGVTADQVVARFLYAWDNLPVAERSIVLHLSGESAGDTLPFAVDENLNEVTLQVTGNDLAVPEPATLGLVVMGVSALFVRRRRGK